VAALRPPGRVTRSGNPKRVYQTGRERGWSERLAKRLRGKPYGVRVSSSTLLRFEKFHAVCKADPDFRSVCLAGVWLTWEHVTRLLPIPDPGLRLRLARRCVDEELSTHALRELIFELAGCPPQRGPRARPPATGPRSAAVAARRLARQRETAAAAADRWFGPAGHLAKLRGRPPAGVGPADVSALKAALTRFRAAAAELAGPLGKVDAAFARAATDRRARWREKHATASHA
jgi:hypothetical protein